MKNSNDTFCSVKVWNSPNRKDGKTGPAERISSRGECESVSVSKLGGLGACPAGKNFKFKSSEMAINASKTANSNINLQLLHRHLKQKVATWPLR